MALAALVLGLAARDLTGQCAEIQTLVPSGQAASDWFGDEVDLDGDVAIVGARGDDTVATDAGAARIFRRQSGVWNETAVLVDPAGAKSDQAGMGVAIKGNVAVVGAYLADDSAGGLVDCGAVLVFRFNGSAWMLEQKIQASNRRSGDQFGIDVALTDSDGDGDGDLFVVGAWKNDTNAGTDSGSAYVYRYKNAITKWQAEAELISSAAGPGDLGGENVAIEGDLVLVGAILNRNATGGIVNAGCATLWQYDPSTKSWPEQQVLTASSPQTNDQFGSGVGIRDDVLVVGCYARDVAGPADSGSAFVFQFDPATMTWLQEQELVASSPGTSDWFGASVAIEEDLVAVAAIRDDHSGFGDNGSVYLFRYCPRSGAWVEDAWQAHSLSKTSDQLGRGLAVDGDYLVAASGEVDTVLGVNVGSAHIFNARELGLEATPETGAACNTLTLDASCGAPGGLSLLALVDFTDPGGSTTPSFNTLGVLPFGSNGHASAGVPVPCSLAGWGFTFVSFTVKPCGNVAMSNLRSVTL